MVSYFLFNGLYIDNIIKRSAEEEISRITFAPDTDSINDYYMYRFGHKKKFTPKPQSYISKELQSFLLNLDQSILPQRAHIGLLLLEFSEKSLKQLMDSIKSIKKQFSKDREIHDCSIFTHDSGGLGFTFMTGTNKKESFFKLERYCSYKMEQQNSNIWIGILDCSTSANKFDFKAIYYKVPPSPSLRS